MTIITLWLLVAVGGYGRNEVVVVDRFPTQEACEHVRQSLPRGPGEIHPPTARCIEAKVAR